jgi:hypothetical protein
LATIAKQDETTLLVAPGGVAANEVKLVTPPFWSVTRSEATFGRVMVPVIRFTVRPPAGSAVREADLAVTLGGRGELSLRVPVGD